MIIIIIMMMIIIIIIDKSWQRHAVVYRYDIDNTEVSREDHLISDNLSKFVNVRKCEKISLFVRIIVPNYDPVPNIVLDHLQVQWWSGLNSLLR